MMQAFGRWQKAAGVHSCKGCGHVIEATTKYLRLGYLPPDVYQAILGMTEKEGSDIPNEKLRRLFQVAANGGYPIEMWHELCWLDDPRSGDTPTVESASVRA